ncbi:MAG: hypothetical protein JW724_06895 [Candidatus Altiarchaeota archaeon]|nr:hypothetical protein [Candidatus Altiarchaeota archaeon]
MDELDEEFVEFFRGMGKSFGWNDLTLRIVAILYIEPEPIAMTDIIRKTGYSPASVSNTMKFLENLYMIERIKKPGTKKAFFHMEKNLAKLNKQKLTAARNVMIRPVKERLPAIIKKYGNRKLDGKSKKKLEIVRQYYDQIIDFERILAHIMDDLDALSSSNSKKYT